MTRSEDVNRFNEALEVLVEQGLEGLAEALRLLIDEVMKLERERFLRGGPYERTEERKGYANGFRPRRLKTRVRELQLRVPQVRDVKGGECFYPEILQRGQRSERALNLTVAEMYLTGVSTRKVAGIVRMLSGFEVSSSQVSRLTAKLDDELSKWRERPLGRCQYLILDARYDNVRHGGRVISEAVLIAIGVCDGKRSVLGAAVGLSEAEVNWRTFLSRLKERGLHGIELVVSDNHEGLKAALRAVFPGVAWQRCQVHIIRNATSYAPNVEIKSRIGRELREVFGCSTQEEASRLLNALVEKYRKPAPKLSKWLEDNVPEGFTVFTLPPAHRRKLRTTNLAENLNREINRRTKIVGVFPNEQALLRLVTAVVAEISDDWEVGRAYLPPP